MSDQLTTIANDHNLDRLGKNLRKVRLKAKLTQLELARRFPLSSGVTEIKISRWECGRAAPNDMELKLFAMNCGTKWSEIEEAIIHG